MVAPVSRPKPPVPQAAPPVSRAAVADDIAFKAIAAARALIDHDDPKVVLAAVKMVIEYEKVRRRTAAQLGYDPLAEQFEPAPQVSDQPAEPTPAPPAEVEPEARPQTRPARPLPIRDRLPVCPPDELAGRLRGVQPSISSFLPPKLSGSNSACPRPTPTPHSSPTPPS